MHYLLKFLHFLAAKLLFFRMNFVLKPDPAFGCTAHMVYFQCLDHAILPQKYPGY